MNNKASVYVSQNKKGTIIKQTSKGYLIDVDGKNEEYMINDIFPCECSEFIYQQLHILQQFWYFSEKFKHIQVPRPGSIKVTGPQKFKAKEIKALDNIEDTYFIFNEHLALVHSNERIPYTFIPRIFNQDIDEEKALIGVHKSITGNKDSKYIIIKDEKETKIFLNSRINYTLSEGYMYLFLEKNPFQEMFMKNVMDILAFESGHKYKYEPLQKIVKYENGITTNKIIGFTYSPDEFVLRRKLSFTWSRYYTTLSNEFVPLVQPIAKHMRIYPWSPIQFLHLQFCYAFHMLEFLTEEMKVDFDNNFPWYTYKQLCGEIFVSLEKAVNEKKVMKWNPNTPLELLRQFNPNDKYILDKKIMQDIWNTEEKRQAWLGNFQNMVLIYSDIISKDYYQCQFLCDDSIVVINNVLIGTFHVNPIHMQASIYEEEKKWIRKDMHIEDLQKKEEQEQEQVSDMHYFMPSKSAFTDFKLGSR
tara:strand:- start:116 stop:1534 length:1419 start_codon:yes stop_codon:yes gene_type:complete